jgi:hypothetical protein
MGPTPVGPAEPSTFFLGQIGPFGLTVEADL